MKHASVVLIIKDSLILGVSRRFDKSKFGLVGGKISPGETPKQAAVREVKEESGLDILDCEEFFRRTEKDEKGEQFFTYCFYAHQWSGDVSSSEEGELKWLTVEELTSTLAAFPDYNIQAINTFKKQYPLTSLKEK